MTAKKLKELLCQPTCTSTTHSPYLSLFNSFVRSIQCEPQHAYINDILQSQTLFEPSYSAKDVQPEIHLFLFANLVYFCEDGCWTLCLSAMFLHRHVCLSCVFVVQSLTPDGFFALIPLYVLLLYAYLCIFVVELYLNLLITSRCLYITLQWNGVISIYLIYSEIK